MRIGTINKLTKFAHVKRNEFLQTIIPITNLYYIRKHLLRHGFSYHQNIPIV